jgi:predicted transposase/invertase (TIGR01784 family)
MRRDSIFYQLFRQSPSLLFEFLDNPPQNAAEYTFEAIEVKETAFRLDGAFLPPSRTGIVYFCEVQFQLDELLYERMNSEIGIYVYRNRTRFADWQAVVIYPSRSIEQFRTNTVRELLASNRIKRVYLDELGKIEDLPIGLGLMVLTTLEGDEAKSEARGLVDGVKGLLGDRSPASRDIIGLISTIIIYKFKNLTREEVDVMLGIELQQTRVYQDAMAEGEAKGEARGEARGEANGEARGKAIGEARASHTLILRLLNRRIGNISSEVELRIKALSLSQLEELLDAALDFTQAGDLLAWLEDRQV